MTDISSCISVSNFLSVLTNKYGSTFGHADVGLAENQSNISTWVYYRNDIDCKEVGSIRVNISTTQIDSETLRISLSSLVQNIPGYHFNLSDFNSILIKSTIKIAKPVSSQVNTVVNKKVEATKDYSYLPSYSVPVKPTVSSSIEKLSIPAKTDSKTENKNTNDFYIKVNKEKVAESALTLAGVDSEKIQKASAIAAMFADQSNITAPNGTKFSKNDIQYLINQGLTEAQAIAELSKLDKYKNIGENDIIKNIAKQAGVSESVAEAIVQAKDGKLDHKVMLKNSANNYVNGLLDDKLKEELAAAGITDYTSMTPEQREKAKQIIISHYDGKLMLNNYIQQLNDKIYNQLNDFVENNVTGMIDGKINQAFSKIDEVTNKLNELTNPLDSVNDQIENFGQKFGISLTKDPTADDVKGAVALNIDKLLNNKVENAVGKVQEFEQQAALFGVETNLSSVIATNVGNAKDMAVSGITKNVTPVVQNIAKQTQQVTKVISDTKAKIDEQKKKITEKLDTLKKEAENMIKEQEEKLIKSALSMLTSNLSIKLKF